MTLRRRSLDWLLNAYAGLALVYLLIPIVLALAVLTAVVLGSQGQPGPSERRAGGVSRALGRRAE